METIWTIGHSTRNADEFIGALQAHGIRLVADVRLLPGSKRYPHFNAEALASSLGAHGIRYEHFRELGGRRKPRPDSRNSAWRVEAFRGYADYMEQAEFRAGIDRLLALANAVGPTALMCAEALWWRCHRGLIADFLKARGIDVRHIAGPGLSEPHPWTTAARLVESELTYGVEDPPARATR